MEYGIRSLAQFLESGEQARISAAAALSMIGAAPISHATSTTDYGVASQLHYGHAIASSITPSAPSGSGSSGSTFSTFALADHIHPVQENITGTATFASRLAEPIRIGLIGAVNAEAIEFDGSESVFIRVTRLDPYALDMPVPVDKGGTGIGALTKNSILYARETNEWGQIPPGTSGQLLTAGATGVPEFKTLTLPQPSDTTPKDLGTASKGSETAFARGDHVHTKPTYTASDVGASPVGHTHETLTIIPNGDTDSQLEYAGTEAKSLSLDFIKIVTESGERRVAENLILKENQLAGVPCYLFNKNFFEGILFSSNEFQDVTQVVLHTKIPFNVENKSYVVFCKGYSKILPTATIDFRISFRIIKVGETYQFSGYNLISNGSIIPSSAKLGVQGDDVLISIELDQVDNPNFRVDVLAQDSDATYYNNWTYTCAVYGTGDIFTTAVYSGLSSITSLSIESPTNDHAHAIADLPKLASGTIFVGAGTSATLGTLDPPSAAGTKWLKVITALEPASQTISWDSPAISDVTGLTAALGGKSASGHTHSYLPTAGGTVTGTIISTAETIMHKVGASGVVTFVSGDMVVANKISLLNIDSFRRTNVSCLRDADGDVSQVPGSPTQLGPSQHTAGTDSVLHLVIGGTGGIADDFTRYLNLPELGTGATEGDKIEMIITNLSSAFNGKIHFNPNSTTVTFRTINGYFLTQSERFFASGERATFHAIKTTPTGALCWRVVKTSETTF